MKPFRSLSAWISVLFLFYALAANSQTLINDFYEVNPGGQIRFGNSKVYSIGFGTNANFALSPTVPGYSIKTTMDATAGRGWTWGEWDKTPVAGLNIAGTFQLKKDLLVGGKMGIGTTVPTLGKLEISGDGSAEGIALFKDASTSINPLYIYKQGGAALITNGKIQDNPLYEHGIAITPEGRILVGALKNSALGTPTAKFTVSVPTGATSGTENIDLISATGWNSTSILGSTTVGTAISGVASATGYGSPASYGYSGRFKGGYFLIETNAATPAPVFYTGLDGKVGIGNNAPVAKLDITATGDGTSLLRLGSENPWVLKQTGTTTASGLRLESASLLNRFEIANSATSVLASFNGTSASSTNSITFLKDGGMIGIGVSPTLGKLQISGNSATEGLVLFGNATANTNEYRQYIEAKNTFFVRGTTSTAAAPVGFIMNELGNVTFGKTLTVLGGSSLKALAVTSLSINGVAVTAVPKQTADANNDTKIEVEKTANEDNIRFTTAAAERMIVAKSGNVGIGTSTPLALLSLGKGSFTAAYASTTGDPLLRFDNAYQAGFIEAKANKIHFFDDGVSNYGIGISQNDFDVFSYRNYRFHTKSTQTSQGVNVFSILENGNVGVGTSNPQSQVHIVDTSQSKIDMYAGLRFIPATTATGPNRVLGFRNGGLVLSGGVTGNETSAEIFLNNTGISFNTGDASLATTSKMILLNNGNVAIGTTESDSKLRIKGQDYLNETQKATLSVEDYVPDVVIQNSEGGINTNHLYSYSKQFHIGANVRNAFCVTETAPLGKYGGRQSFYVLDDPYYSGWDLAMGNDLYGSSAFRIVNIPAGTKQSDYTDESITRFLINDVGQVAIGTAKVQDGYRLSVNGGIACTKVVVKTNTDWGWPDYVFAKDYKLRPLAEVASFVDENKHLPDVPKAADITENGVDLGQMDAVLLRKVEELTLYILEQEKRIAQLEAQAQSAPKRGRKK